jgi:hypothetical protein
MPKNSNPPETHPEPEPKGKGRSEFLKTPNMESKKPM